MFFSGCVCFYYSIQFPFTVERPPKNIVVQAIVNPNFFRYIAYFSLFGMNIGS